MSDTGSRAAITTGTRRWWPWLALLCLLCCGAASALSRDGSLRDLRHTAWGPKEGAPDGINSLAQTSDGFLWMGSAPGLFRFDGLRFEHIDLPRDDRLSSAKIYKLFAPASGGLWIGFAFGGAAFLKDGRMTAYAKRDGLEGAVVAFAEDSSGTVWAGTNSGLARLEGSTWQKMGPEQHYSDARTEELLLDSAGTLWAVSADKVLFLPQGQKVFHESAVQPVEPSARRPGVQGIAESASGAVWLFSDQAIRQLRKNDNPGARTAASGFGIVSDPDGSLWMARSDGVLQRIAHPENLSAQSWTAVEDPSDSYSVKDGLSFDSGYGGMLVDREGNVWFATAAGLDRFSERNVSRVVPAPVLAPRRHDAFVPLITAMAAGDGGALWIGGRTLTLHDLQDGDMRRHDEVGYIACAIRADDESLWFGYTTSVWKYASGRFERTALPENPERSEVQAMAQDRSGGLWVSIVGKGVFRLADGRWTARGGIESLPELTAVSLSTDTQGRIWFGYTEGRVAVLDGGRVRMMSDKERLPIGNVTALYGRRGTVWAGGEFGLARFDGDRFQAVVPEAGTTFNNVTGIVETAGGELWLNTSAGIVRVTAAETRSVASDPSHRIHGEVFDARDGILGSSARIRPLPTAVEGTDGRLWFTTSIGLYAMDPARIHRNPVPPPVMIQSLTVDGKGHVPSAGLQLPQRSTSLRIDYVGVDLTLAEKVRYRYKLDGVDKAWQDAEGRRQAFYTNLAPGPHRFRVIAANHDGVWNEAGATLDFFIPPTFVQTGWFIALCVAAAAAAIGLLVRIRLRQLATRMRARYAERMAERERIARELHDTLLQSTQGLILRFQAAANDIPQGTPTRDKLEKALDSADEVIAEGRDRVMDLRVAADALADLPQAFATAGGELAEGRAVAFKVVVEGPPRELVRGVKDEAYRIGREALLNAFRHAGAGSIEVQIIHADEDFRIRVRDDGLGIDSAALQGGSRPGHWGLPGMRERARQIGAALDIWSRPGGGTEIELTIPAAIAYRERARRLRWLRRWGSAATQPTP